MTQSGPDSENHIKAVETSISIISVLEENGVDSVSNISKQTGHSQATVSKHLATLRAHGFVVKTDGKYGLGLGYLRLGSRARDRIPGSRIIKQKMVELAAETNHVAEFIIENDGKAVVLFRELGDQGIPGRTRVGSKMFIHQVAAGKAILAHRSTEEIEDVIERHGLPQSTENTITDRETLFDELETVRESGYAVNDEESTDGLYALAVPVQLSDGRVLGACTVSGPTYSLKNTTETDDLLELLLQLSNEIELKLSYS